MDRDAARNKLKQLIVSELGLAGTSPTEIDDGAPLLGGTLGLNSLDAIQVAIAVEEQFGVRLPEGEEARELFASVDALVEFIVSRRTALS